MSETEIIFQKERLRMLLNWQEKEGRIYTAFLGEGKGVEFILYHRPTGEDRICPAWELSIFIHDTKAWGEFYNYFLEIYDHRWFVRFFDVENAKSEAEHFASKLVERFLKASSERAQEKLR